MRATVIKSTGSFYDVRVDDDGRILQCTVKGKMRTEGIKSTNPVAVGDYVNVEIADAVEQTGEITGAITEVLERRNYVVRKASNLSKQTHILAANVDQALLVVTVNYPITTTTFIDRFLASAEAYDVPVVIVFNKTDRYDSQTLAELEALEALYQSMGYKTIRAAAKNMVGIDAIREVLKDKVSVVAGHSGVGKSTLINKVQPGLNLRTDEISETNNQGKHTTTSAEMHPFDFGGYVIDTPGVRGFGIVNIDKNEVAHYFRDIFHVSGGCQYNNCTHLHEPGCAVKEAVENGEIAFSRYQSYVNIFEAIVDGGKYR